MIQMKQGKTKRNSAGQAFTLVELLVVIAIISVIAGLTVGVFGGASVQKVRMMTKSQLSKIQTGIDGYKSKFGAYPPSDPNPVDHEVNALFYELTGSYFDPATSIYRSIYKQENTLTTANLTTVFGSAMAGMANAHAAGQNPEPFAMFKPDEFAEVSVGGVNVLLLTVPSKPVQGGYAADANYWHYRARPVDGYNPTTYDLWAEIRGKKANDKETIGNWKTR